MRGVGTMDLYHVAVRAISDEWLLDRQGVPMSGAGLSRMERSACNVDEPCRLPGCHCGGRAGTAAWACFNRSRTRAGRLMRGRLRAVCMRLSRGRRCRGSCNRRDGDARVEATAMGACRLAALRSRRQETGQRCDGFGEIEPALTFRRTLPVTARQRVPARSTPFRHGAVRGVLGS